MNAVRRRTVGLLLAGLLLATGTPAYLAVSRELEAYLLHPAVFGAQALPYLLAAALWLPGRSAAAASIGQWVAGALAISSSLLYIPMLTGHLPMGGDMVALAFIGIGAVTSLVVLVTTAIAYSLLHRRTRDR